MNRPVIPALTDYDKSLPVACTSSVLDNLLRTDYVLAIGVNDMKTMGVGEIRAHFSDILEKVKGGEKITVVYGKKKVAVIVPYDEYRPQGKRRLGLLRGKAGLEIRPGFEITDDDLSAS